MWTLVLNTNYLPIGVIPAERAFKAVFIGTVEQIKSYNKVFRSPNAEWKVPCIIKTKRYVTLPYTKSTLTKQNVFKRDRHECKYCGEDDRRKLTIDHIIPRSKGGKNKWENLVTSCFSCNNIKGNRTPTQMGWSEPTTGHPHYILLMSSFLRVIPEDWKAYLFV